MIVVDVPRHGVAVIDDDDGCAAYESVTDLRTSQACRDGGAPVELRLVVEVLRRCGGMAPRALLGGRFVAGEGDATTYVVHRGIPWAEGPGPPCPSRLWNRPYLAGLPEEYAGAALEGVAADAGRCCPRVFSPSTAPRTTWSSRRSSRSGWPDLCCGTSWRPGSREPPWTSRHAR